MKPRKTHLRIVTVDGERIADPPVTVQQVYDFFVATEADPRARILGYDFCSEILERCRYIVRLVLEAHEKALPMEANREWELTKEALKLFEQLKKEVKEQLGKQ